MRLLNCRIALVLLVATFCFGRQAPRPDDTVFSDAVAEKAMNTLRNGLIGHSPDLMLSAFDRDKMAGYNAFADQVRALFEQYDSFRVYAHIIHSSVENGRGIVSLQFEMDKTPRDPTVPAIRKSGELQLEMEHSAKGWKIVDLRPRGFFTN